GSLRSMFVFLLSHRPPPRSPLFPYTTLFRSVPSRLLAEEASAHPPGLSRVRKPAVRRRAGRPVPGGGSRVADRTRAWRTALGAPPWTFHRGQLPRPTGTGLDIAGAGRCPVRAGGCGDPRSVPLSAQLAGR